MNYTDSSQDKSKDPEQHFSSSDKEAEDKSQAYFITLHLSGALSESDIAQIAAFSEENVLAVITDQPEGASPPEWRIKWMTAHAPNLALWADKLTKYLRELTFPFLHSIKVNQLTLEEIPETDWVAQTIESFAPFTCGNFFIYDSHHKSSKSVPADALPLEINATTAFGTGQHPTTMGCLLALEELDRKNFVPRRVLDMGCGTGILAIAAAKLWPDAQVIAVDNDPESIRVAKNHITMNSTPSIITRLAEGFEDSALRDESEGAFDLVLANILATPLKIMAPDMNKYSHPKAYAILSGLLISQSSAVIKAYKDQDFAMVKSHEIEEWAALLMQKSE